jgi:GNAT superfamily N-acetyltransferase
MIKVFDQGKIIDIDLYLKLQDVENNNVNFKGCPNEFKTNRTWWVEVDKKGLIIAYCGSIYSEGICILNRAWVKKQYRGKGFHKKMIQIRLRAAKKTCTVAITYTIYTNFASANNLISQGFKLYEPVYKYGGEVLYFTKQLNAK